MSKEYDYNRNVRCIISTKVKVFLNLKNNYFDKSNY